MALSKRDILLPPRVLDCAHPGYPFDVLVCINMEPAVVLAAAQERMTLTKKERRIITETRASSRGFCVTTDSGAQIISVSHFGDFPNARARLAHEVFHAVDGMMDRVGIRLTQYSDEAYAYAIQGLTESIETEMRIARGATVGDLRRWKRAASGEPSAVKSIAKRKR